MSKAQTINADFAVSRTHLQRRPLFFLSLFAVLLVLVVVVLGAFTRLSDAGLGCPDWPGCYGHLTWPKTTEDVALAEARFPETPVEHDKTWPEMVHRYFAGTLGLVIFAIAWLSWRAHRTDRAIPLRLPLFLAGLVILQAAFGMWTVTLKLWPQVVTAHLLGGFATAAGLWLLVLRLSGWKFPSIKFSPGLKTLAAIGLLAVVIQIALGGWTSANYAAIACPDLPTCHGVWWPPADFLQGFNIFQHVGPNYLGGLLDNHARTAIHFTHRLGAVTVTLILITLAISLWRSGAWGRKMTVVLLAVLTLQVGLGISNVYWVLPLPVAVAHNGVGLVLLLVLVALNYGLRKQQHV
ncbi:heme A synthase [Saccharophagus sp. K07]|jgi:cytochrome c oxidase assembly protein subunit 15|uniref:COX15/CtaA family protein n=1 Tax=Saccharophagus sp. K07 TaxID=2283636 RepID=UPI001651E76E|nr:COX15/CtaA family protein [Saccharophagus sp. K07]MBC6906182.1 heme A synthase [Saccharophagus sp. K07]